MNEARGLWPFFTLAFLIWLATSVSAQTETPPEISREMVEKSHFLEGLSPPQNLSETIEALVKKRQSEKYQRIFDLLKQGKIKPAEAIKDLAFLKGLRDNPAIPESLKKLIDQYTDPEHARTLTPQDLEEIRNFARKPRDEVEGKDGAAPKSQNSPEPSRDGNSAGRRLPRGGGSSGPTKEEQQQLAQRVMRWLSGSPAMRQALRDLGRRLGEEDPRWGRLSARFDEMRERWDKLSQKLQFDHLASGETGSWLARILPSGSLQWGLSGDQSAAAQQRGIDDAAGGSLSASSFTWLAFAAIVVLILTVVTGWSLMARSRQLLGARQQEEWRLGPWPVNPGDVLTRGELVQAFEYLSLLNLGPDARNWNHRVIASRLGDEKKLKKYNVAPASWPRQGRAVVILPVNDPLHRVVVGELASIYEQARYAPPGDPLPETSLEAARRDLCLLAGVTAA
jgi:hypothetical protein